MILSTVIFTAVKFNQLFCRQWMFRELHIECLKIESSGNITVVFYLNVWSVDIHIK